MKYLYVLTSDSSDYYMEQAMLSIVSLRNKMPNALVTLLVDTSTEANLIGKRSGICSLVDELVSVKIDDRFNKKARSRWLKTSMRQHIKGNFLYVDGDTIITEELSALSEMNIDLGAILDKHSYLSDIKKYSLGYRWLENVYKRLEFVSINSDTHFNGGVLLCRDCDLGHKFFEEWHRLWLLCFEKGILTDQQSFNEANYNLGNIIIELAGKWNCQIIAYGGVKNLHDAKIIHYFSSASDKNPYIFSNQEIYKKIRDIGFIDREISDMLAFSKSLFTPDTRLQTKDSFTKSTIYFVAKYIYHSKIGIVLESIFCLFMRKKGNILFK